MGNPFESLEVDLPGSPDSSSTKRKAEGPPDDSNDSPSKRTRSRTRAAKTDESFTLVQRPGRRGKISVQNFSNSKSNFSHGSIIRFPMHVPNMDANATTESYTLKRTPIGGVYSKMRNAVVIWKFARRMLVVPMFSSAGKGIMAQREEFRHEYVEICDEDKRKKYPKEGVHDVLGADMNANWRIHRKSALNMAGCVSVDYWEDIQIIGIMTKQSSIRLKRLIRALLDRSDQEEKNAGY